MWFTLAVVAFIYAKYKGIDNLFEAIVFTVIIFISTKEVVEFLLCFLRHLR